MKKILVILILISLYSICFSENDVHMYNPREGIEIGNVLPDFQLYDLKGNKIDMKKFEGKSLMLNFWATWCPPCRFEMPSIESLYQRSKGKDFEIIAVSVDAKPASDVEKFIKENSYNFPVYYDKGQELSRKFLVRSIPLTYIINKNRIIVEKEIGAKDWSDLEIEKLTKGE